MPDQPNPSVVAPAESPYRQITRQYPIRTIQDTTLWTARNGYHIAAIQATPTRMAGETGCSVAFATEREAYLRLDLRKREDVLELISALQEAIGITPTP